MWTRAVFKLSPVFARSASQFRSVASRTSFVGAGLAASTLFVSSAVCDSAAPQVDSQPANEQTQSPTEAKTETKKSKTDDDDDGEIDLECDCLRVMKQGPCGEIFMTSARCFNASKTRPRGQDCEKEFRAMVMCFQEHDEFYKKLEHEERLKMEAAELEEVFAEMDKEKAAKAQQSA